MSDIQQIYPLAKTVLQSIKSIFWLLQSKRFMAAGREFLNLFKLIYNNHLKGKYITVNERKIPMTAVVAAVVVLLFVAFPSSDKEKVKATAEETAQMQSMEKDGVRVRDVHQCGKAVCGVLENTTENDLNSVQVVIIFHAKNGEPVYQGGIDAKMDPQSRTDFEVNSELPYEYFELNDLVVEP